MLIEAEHRQHQGAPAISDVRASKPRSQAEGAAPSQASNPIDPATTDPAPTDPASIDPTLAELRRAKAAAEAANEAKSRYLVAVSHEIRSPLNAIYGYAQLLERGDAISGVEAGAAIRRSVDHLTSLAESLLELSHVESGVLKVQSDVVDIRALLEQITSMFRAQAMTKGLDLRLEISSRLPPLVKTDQKRLKQVLINLVSNAIKYTEAGHVEIRVDHRNEVATIDVIDTGIGIEPGEMDRAFEPFERGASRSVQRQPGIGLGLAITRVLVQVLGGEITATSTPGQGSRFRVKLMLSSVAAPRPTLQRSAVEGYTGPRRSVLIIEDDPAQRATLHSLLTSLGFGVEAAASGEEGLELAGRCRPDIVLLDVEMPGIDGWQTATTLRAAHGAGLKIILATARMEPEARGGDQAYDAMLAKPVAFEALFSTMEQLGIRWDRASPEPLSAAPPIAASLPAEAHPYLQPLHQLARMGHVLEFERLLAELEDAVPAAGAFAATLRSHLIDFDFAGVIEKIENAGA